MTTSIFYCLVGLADIFQNSIIRGVNYSGVHKSKEQCDIPLSLFHFIGHDRLDDLCSLAKTARSMFFDFFVYGSWEPLGSVKILARSVATFSTPGEAIPRIFEKSTFFYISAKLPISSNGPFQYGSISPSMALRNFGTPHRVMPNTLVYRKL